MAIASKAGILQVGKKQASNATIVMHANFYIPVRWAEKVNMAISYAHFHAKRAQCADPMTTIANKQNYCKKFCNIATNV